MDKSTTAAAVIVTAAAVTAAASAAHKYEDKDYDPGAAVSAEIVVTH